MGDQGRDRVGDRAIVLGAGMAGLLAARVLSGHYRDVTVVERDDLTGVTGARRGVPQGRHAHGLVARGHQIFEALFPRLTDELVAAGVRPGDLNGDIRWYFNGLRLRPAASGLISVPATRPVLEYHVRERVRALANVTFIEGCDIAGLAFTPDSSRVTGVRIRRGAGGTQETLEADLTVDATGRGSRTPVWLEEHGYARPAEQRVRIDLGYATRHFRLDADPFGKELAIIPAATPSHPRGAFFYRLPGEGNRVELSLTGMLGDHPPTDPDGFLDFAASIPVPDIHRAVRDAEPLDDAVGFRYPASVRRRYELLARFPGGLLVLGDGMCSFNPIYAQGMTVAALESLVLDRHLSQGTAPQATAFFRDAAKHIAAPWAVSAGGDLGYAGVEGRRTARVRFINAYVARLQRAAVHDSGLTNAFIRVAGLIDPPYALMRPDRIASVVRNGGRAAVPDGAAERSDAGTSAAAAR